MSAIACTTVSDSSVVSTSVWTVIASVPEVLTIGEEASLMPVAATASRILSTLSWVASPAPTDTLYSLPPSNSMPRLSPLKYRPPTASSTITPEIEYQSHLRPTKSIETSPS